MEETKDLIVCSASTRYVAILFILFFREIMAFSITVADTEAKRKIHEKDCQQGNSDIIS